ncbi:MAG: RnfABCDGE type electron transport complex subunit D [Gammaproteobacteria bacterium]|nr:RnfABCDGE type electron transport complex subunit D [Gammaproteobacteria bacterium]
MKQVTLLESGSLLADGRQPAAPYLHAPATIAVMMRWVMLALIPATLLGFYQFGWPAILLFLVTVGSALLAEAVALALAGKPLRLTLQDGSALLCGWLLALTLPPWAPWWIGVLGAFLAIIVAKQVFGGIGQNLFNPAMVARVALLISFPLEMTLFTAPQPLFSATAPDFLQSLGITFAGASVDAYTGATLLGHLKTELARGVAVSELLPQGVSWWQFGMGAESGSLGETSALLLLLGGLLLLYKRIISWVIPLALLVGVTLPALLAYLLDAERFLSPLTHLLSGGVMLTAFFIATDPVTSPVTRRGQILFAFGCGLLLWIIRTFAGYPEGAAFAVLLMNAFTPLIDHYLKPRIYGRDRHGEPLRYAAGGEP